MRVLLADVPDPNGRELPAGAVQPGRDYRDCPYLHRPGGLCRRRCGRVGQDTRHRVLEPPRPRALHRLLRRRGGPDRGDHGQEVRGLRRNRRLAASSQAQPVYERGPGRHRSQRGGRGPGCQETGLRGDLPGLSGRRHNGPGRRLREPERGLIVVFARSVRAGR